jgi:Protein of unknown function (DUF1571)
MMSGGFFGRGSCMAARKDAAERLTPFHINSLAMGLAALVLSGCFVGGKSYLPRAQVDGSLPVANPALSAEPAALRITPPPPPDSLTPFVSDTTMESALGRLAKKAVESEKKLNNYICRIKRREQSGGQDQPEEIIQLRFRRAPLSIHMKWLGNEAKGREIVYVQGQYDNKLHLLTGTGDLFGAGKHMTFAPDSPLMRAKSHYPVTEVGLGAITSRFVAVANAIERGQANLGAAKYLGLQMRPEFPQPVEGVEQSIPPGVESFLPKGGLRYYYFDEKLGVPTVAVTFDVGKHEVEYYSFDRVQIPVDLDDADFDPVKMWNK